MNTVASISALFASKLSGVESLEELESLRIEFLGRKGAIQQAFSLMSELPTEEKRLLGQSLNTLKGEVTAAIATKQESLAEALLAQRLSAEFIDVTLEPRTEYQCGTKHPIHEVIRDVKRIFYEMGFKLAVGPDIDDDYNNFTALNITEHHPARQSHDTFYIDSLSLNKDGLNKNLEKRLLLRTHTSTVQIRHLNTSPPPCRIISVGKVYRADMDSTHTPMFHQIEGLCIDKGITMSHLKGTLEHFLRVFFQVDDLPIRLRPSYFPFTEPSAEIDIRCQHTKELIKVGSGSSWLEVLGCGMVSPVVLENVKIDSTEYQGFAFGIGIDRLAMLKYNIPDLRACFEGDMRWLSYYGL
ncbi:phenylalanine--tRNA ligase subunit alpha [Rickettsiales endosymbiont of Peranema trichophorum]|uniref:phenylalanine--tRNA ligase subunit alpha n=1 Tax=Rickettsiales endosymbiont of Peranema trichophorum TaxID=2486577 RepID=UPI001022B46F|nr:phenylalanine--tRNA ligase subunit alpha [Rickettsiales endosymbiont of Peranema trichophorum]RZI45251.1 phenylalanine--tRNA ligase subunit alpha [Rickettsiales endosymbiont of Peranema trichophorum]